MLPFSFMELFFFLSLGITFVLILLIVYHFKQRITTMEHKSDTMFDIVQNLAKEIATMKTTHISLSNSHPSAEFGGGMFMPSIFMHQPVGSMGFQMSECENEDDDANLEPVVEELDGDVNMYDETDNETEYSDDESDSDDETDSDDSIILTGEDYDVELCEINNKNMCIVIDEEENFQKIKVEDNLEPIINENLNLEGSETRIERQETLIEEELSVPKPELVSENPVVSQEPSNESIVNLVSIQDDYKKMSTSELKKLVVSKGNALKEINKLKRQDLLKLLEKSV